jgi:hypothetical protein
MYQALMQDIRSTGIDPEILAALMKQVNFDRLPSFEKFDFTEPRPNQLHFLYAFFIFFNLPCGDEFIREWSNEGKRSELVRVFMTKYRNDPEINPGLIESTPASL